MEDVIALVLVVGLAASVIALSVWFYKLHKRKTAEENARLEQRKKEVEEYWAKKREGYALSAIKVDGSGNVGIGSVPPRGKETTKKYTPSYAPSTTQSVQSYSSRSDDTSMNDLSDTINTIANIAMIANTVNHWNDHSSSSSSSDTSSSSSSSSSSSWGFDDDDSRKSISSSMSSDSYSSSSSSDSWSSSDSGPSSDW